MTRRDVLSRLAIPFPSRSVLGLCVLLGFQPLVLQGQDKLKPLAVQQVGEFQVEVWSVDPIEPSKLTEKFGSAASGIGFDVDQMMSRVGSPSTATPTSRAPLGFQGQVPRS